MANTNKFKLSSQLPNIYYLFKAKEKKYTDLVESIELNEAMNENDLNEIILNIKNEVLLKPVTIQKPKISKTNSNLVYGQNINLFNINFPVEGSLELFMYQDQSNSLGSSSYNVYEPDHFDSINVIVQMSGKGKHTAMIKAENLLKDTFNHIKINNSIATSWSLEMELKIQLMIRQKNKQQ